MTVIGARSVVPLLDRAGRIRTVELWLGRTDWHWPPVRVEQRIFNWRREGAR